MVYVNIIHTKQLLCQRRSFLSSLELCTTAMKRSLVRKMFLFWHIFGFCLKTCTRHDTYSQATPGLLNMFIIGCDKFASNQLCESRSSTIVFLFTWSTWRPFSPAENAIVFIYIACGCLQCDSILGGEYVYLCATGCDEFGGNELCLPRTSTSVFLVYLIYFKAV